MSLRRGFSLIEVNMAILVVAGGLLTLFALFPAGLRMSTMSIADMRHSMFAAEAFARMQANAARIQSRDTWMDPRLFWDALCKGITRPTMWDEMARQADPASGPLKKNPKDLSPRQGSPSPSPQWFYAEGEIETYFTSKSGYVKAPARFKIRLHRQHPGTIWQKRVTGLNRQLPSGRDPHLDYLTWRISIVISDQPDVVFDENPTYHLELRFPGTP
jgi:hypothetical protein